MKKIFLYFLLFFTLYLTFAESKRPFIVIIDAGHGDMDFGACVNKQYEKDINLSVSQKLCKYIKQYYPLDVKVIQTRKTDKFISLMERVNIANRYHADLFISIHCNSTYKTSSIGTETYVLSTYCNEDNFKIVK